MSQQNEKNEPLKIEWKVLTYGHYKKAKRLFNALVPADDPDYDEDEALDSVVIFAIGLIDSWNFLDENTNKPLPALPESMDLLSLDQFLALFESFKRKFGLTGVSLGQPDQQVETEPEGELKKTNASPLSSGSIGSQPATIKGTINSQIG